MKKQEEAARLQAELAEQEARGRFLAFQEQQRRDEEQRQLERIRLEQEQREAARKIQDTANLLANLQFDADHPKQEDDAQLVAIRAVENLEDEAREAARRRAEERVRLRQQAQQPSAQPVTRAETEVPALVLPEPAAPVEAVAESNRDSERAPIELLAPAPENEEERADTHPGPRRTLAGLRLPLAKKEAEAEDTALLSMLLNSKDEDFLSARKTNATKMPEPMPEPDPHQEEVVFNEMKWATLDPDSTNNASNPGQVLGEGGELDDALHESPAEEDAELEFTAVVEKKPEKRAKSKTSKNGSKTNSQAPSRGGPKSTPTEAKAKPTEPHHQDYPLQAKDSHDGPGGPKTARELRKAEDKVRSPLKALKTQRSSAMRGLSMLGVYVCACQVRKAETDLHEKKEKEKKEKEKNMEETSGWDAKTPRGKQGKNARKLARRGDPEAKEAKEEAELQAKLEKEKQAKERNARLAEKQQRDAEEEAMRKKEKEEKKKQVLGRLDELKAEEREKQAMLALHEIALAKELAAKARKENRRPIN